ncbi:MAG: alpha/beta hydrolase family protein, partial [Mycobacterium leprae]
GWWNLYRWEQGTAVPLRSMEAEFGEPQWVFGRSTYGFMADGRIICAYTGAGLWHLALMDPANKKKFHTLDVGCTDISAVKALASGALFVGGSAHRFPAIMRWDANTGACQVLRRASAVQLDPGYLSQPEPVEFPTNGGVTAFGLFYEPENKDFTAPLDDRPPLIVISHGGPTAQASSSLKLTIQYWTSRGFAVLDVNYGGSSGYGRAYRERLNGHWGIVDVNDCVNGARYLAEKGRVDGNRMSIMGGSAGGYTTLAALTFHDIFRAGVSFFGVSDLESLAQDTHKFESRYLDRLVGPYPESRELYRSRSPIHFTDRLSCPVIFFQGLEDRVVPPNQAEKMVETLRAKGLPVAYLPFEGEGHGFRRAENNKRALEAQLYFYARLYRLAVADVLEPVAIDNL